MLWAEECHLWDHVDFIRYLSLCLTQSRFRFYITYRPFSYLLVRSGDQIFIYELDSWILAGEDAA
jgi:hypothetical protein